MSVEQLLILIITGLLAGFVAGTFGVGGGIVMIPALVFVIGMSQHDAQGTTLATMLAPIGIFAVINYHKAGYVNWKFALILILTFLIGSYFGSKLAIQIQGRVLKQVFGVLMIFVALKMIFGK